MLTPAELKATYTQAELISIRDTLKTQRAALLGGESIASINEPNLPFAYNPPATLDDVNKELSSVAKALQMMRPDLYGTDLLRVRRKFIL